MEHPQPLNVIGPQIRKLREQQGLEQQQLAAKCQIAGLDITRGTLAKIEAGVRTVADYEVHVFAKVLKVALEALFPRKAKVLKRKVRNPHGARRLKAQSNKGQQPGRKAALRKRPRRA